MTRVIRHLPLLALLFACSQPMAATVVDAGSDDAGTMDGGEDGGPVQCVAEGSPCGPSAPCCDTTLDYCNVIEAVCLPLSTGADGGFGPDGGESDGGDGGPPFPADGVQWTAETVGGSITGFAAISAPSAQVQVAVGSGTGSAQVLQRSTEDGGWFVVPGVPVATQLYGVSAIPGGDVFAVGIAEGAGLLLAGNLDGGLTAVNLDGLPEFLSLKAVVGLGPGEALAGGEPLDAGMNGVLHLLPDGGVSMETLPPELSQVYRMIRTDAGTVYALADSTDNNLPAWVLERTDGGWTSLPQVNALEAGGFVTLLDVAAGEAGDVTVGGNDGNGNGLIYTLADGGFDLIMPPGALPPVTALCETAEGDLYIASAVESTSQAQMTHVTGGLNRDMWSSETLPATAQQVNGIATDGTDVFAVGVGSNGFPLAAEREAP